MKSQVEFYLNLELQLVRRDPLETSSSVKKRCLERDLETIQSRVQSEGLSFLTKTLPLLGKAVDRALECGKLNVPRGFKLAPKCASRPAFLQAYFSLVFDEDGFLLDTVNVDALRHIRQVLYIAYKLKIPYSKSEETAVIDRFVQVDKDLGLQCDPLTDRIMQLAMIITGRVFNDFDHKDIHPRHGPGAVATGEKLEAKWKFSRLYSNIHQVYPYYDYYVAGGAREIADRLAWYRSLTRVKSGSAKVVLVPKDSRGPRLISCEPLEYQWIQQGLGRKLANFLEYGSPYTRKRVNFTHQDINRTLAKASSASLRFSTLDLKDASDRVSLELVRRVFERTPKLLRALEACRTTETRLPDGSFVTLNKFAPMGSALCFPVEAFLFWVIIVSAVVLHTNLPLNAVGRRVYVYGDDIVVPTEWASLSIQALSLAGLQVNLDKSCINGYFRESCGIEAYHGHDITPVRLSTLWSTQSHDGSCLASYSSLANKLAEMGYTEASEFIWNALEVTYGKIPFGTFRASYPCKLVSSALKAETLNRSLFRSRYNKDFQRVEFLLPSLSSRRIRSKLDSWPRLLRDLVSPPVGDPSSVVLRRSTKIKRRWTTAA